MIYITFFIVILIDKRDGKRSDKRSERLEHTRTYMYIHVHERRRAPSGTA